MPSVGLAAAASWERMREREEHVMATTGRMKRRLIGMLQKRIGEARLDEVPDSRDRRGRRWELGTLLAGALLGLVAGSRSLRDVEQLTAELLPPRAACRTPRCAMR